MTSGWLTLLSSPHLLTLMKPVATSWGALWRRLGVKELSVASGSSQQGPKAIHPEGSVRVACSGSSPSCWALRWLQSTDTLPLTWARPTSEAPAIPSSVSWITGNVSKMMSSGAFVLQQWGMKTWNYCWLEGPCSSTLFMHLASESWVLKFSSLLSSLVLATKKALRFQGNYRKQMMKNSDTCRRTFSYFSSLPTLASSNSSSLT
jgi:hypothetical protein